jgi:hypothetical protein
MAKLTFKKDYSEEEAFICNIHHHSFAIRKINNKWYNLNHTNPTPPGPGP